MKVNDENRLFGKGGGVNQTLMLAFRTNKCIKERKEKYKP